MKAGRDRLQLPERDGGHRYPGLDVMSLARHWDPATTAAVASRLGRPPDLRFFTQDQVLTASALCDRLLDQNEDPRVPVVNLIDARLAEQQTDGWHYEDMPPDDEAWRTTVAALDSDAQQRHGSRFHELEPTEQSDLLHGIQHAGSDQWHGMTAAHVWSLWTRYACVAFYSHPWASVAHFAYSMGENDRRLMAAARSTMEDILRAAGAQVVMTIERFAHLVGGARMAQDERHGVVDASCRTFAVPNLYITDGSVLPTQGSANPALTIMALAARTADGLARRSANPHR